MWFLSMSQLTQWSVFVLISGKMGTQNAPLRYRKKQSDRGRVCAGKIYGCLQTILRFNRTAKRLDFRKWPRYNKMAYIYNKE